MKIERVEIKNFKSFKKAEIKLNTFNLITGVNSSGKSSFIQSLLLAKQNEEKFYSFRGGKMANINDKYVRLGNKKDILFRDVLKENVEIKLFSKSIYHNFIFNTENLRIEQIELLPEGDENNFNLFFDDFQYISTDRIEPKISYNLSDEDIERNLIGFRGEYTAHYLAKNGEKNIENDLRHKGSKTAQLLENVSLWLGEISHKIEVKAKIYDGLQQVNLTYNYTYGDRITKDYTPLNVGFGITYVLPIIVAILKAKKGDLVIIENPESHLHPAGQSKIAELCAIASANGVQIILETHSDHILNGIMIATKNKILKANESKIYFFKKEKGELETKIDELNINSEGKIDKWPKDFFDQYENDMMELL